MASATRPSLTLELGRTDTRRRDVSVTELVLDEILSPSIATECRNQTIAMTPTPTQFLCPMSVTEEQEAYANGFARALEELYRNEGRPNLQPCTNAVTTKPSFTSANATTLVQTFTSVGGMAESLCNRVNKLQTSNCSTSQSFSSVGICSNTVWPANTANLQTSCFLSSDLNFTGSSDETLLASYFKKFASPAVTSVSSWPNGTGFSSLSESAVGGNGTLHSVADSTVGVLPERLNLDEQDEMKLERKRAKNRVAAARCQMRKMERIARLQEKAQELRNNNAALAKTVADLTSHVSNLRKQILLHSERGCRLMIPTCS